MRGGLATSVVLHVAILAWALLTIQAQRELPKDPRVLRTIVKEAGQSLGMYASVESAGRVSVGDEVTLV